MNNFGLYRGVVLDNNDDKKLCRLRVSIPQVYGPEAKISELPWANPCFPFVGGNAKDNDEVLAPHGMIYIPTVKSTVWVMFEGGNINFPVWIGTWIGNKDIPNEIQNDYPNTAIIKYPSGFYILFDKEKMEIGYKNPETETVEAKIVLDKSDAKISINPIISSEFPTWALELLGKEINIKGLDNGADKSSINISSDSDMRIKGKDTRVSGTATYRVSAPQGGCGNGSWGT